jgi:[ribosomal protein S18]-alanine N-acetyltransferase
MLALEREVPSLVHWSEQSYLAAFAPGALERSVLVIEHGKALLAFLIARFSETECELENIVVASPQRRHGLALQLLKTLIADARKRGAARILLEVRESNTAARGLYEKVGFRVSGRRKSYYSLPREDALSFELALNCTSSCADNVKAR